MQTQAREQSLSLIYRGMERDFIHHGEEAAVPGMEPPRIESRSVMADMVEDWGVDVDRGPDWLFLRLRPGKQEPEGVADKLWSLADRHFVYRLVVEMNDLDVLPSHLMGQLVVLQKRVLQRDGALRLCGLTDDCAQAIHFCRLDSALPNYDCREDAVMGKRRPHLACAN